MGTGNKTTDENTDALAGGVSDEAVMQLVAKGDRDAFAVLVRKYQAMPLNFFYRMNVYSGDRDDLMQETFLRLFKYRERYRPTAKFTTFLYMMARQVQIDYFRKQQRRMVLAKAFGNEPREEEPGSGQNEDRKMQIEKTLNTLSEEMRCVIVMSIYQDLKYAEIAEILDIPVGTVKTRMFHALQKLRKVIKHEE
jgi:RNA polymerase sigma-70 factor (ECF subfamily)